MLLRQETFPHGCLDLVISPEGKMLATIDVASGGLCDRKFIFMIWIPSDYCIYFLNKGRLLFARFLPG